MKINSFQIKNYRSIVDSQKCCLSPDYITALIGQNESGKTSVLEALRSYYEGQITDDVLRSDLTFPEITCTFTLDDNKTLADYIEPGRLPAPLHSIVTAKREATVTRKWLNAHQSRITLAEDKILDFYNKLEDKKLECSHKIIASIDDLMVQSEAATREAEALENEVAVARMEINAAYTHVEELKKTISKDKNHDVQISAQQDLEHAQKHLIASEENLKEKLTALEVSKVSRQELADKLTICRLFNDTSGKIQALSEELKVRTEQVLEAEYHYKQSQNDREARNVSKNLEHLRGLQVQLKDEWDRQMAYLSKSRKMACKMLDGLKMADAERESMMECDIENNYATAEEMGGILFRHMPAFEFFEDFSSLLPNKIDLDDLLNENIHAEGYKAARNFLAIAGLNANFFREDNHRILQQKIENLNSEITVDFQDYWRQSVGKDDKIRINFELEHYDNSQPEKSGKPYLEFWVKDKQERLYPKQRSRGVRWFLSFYLELKATAKQKSTDRVMLIDEPGLSLHARAQEDVLKVFEDLRENLQIIYTTHSPNLIDLKKLYRIIAVQRARDTDETSETIVLDARSLNEASSDTLSPIYALMGTRLNDRQFIFPKNNFIVEDSVTFHYIEAMSMLFGIEGPVHYIPASGAELVPNMANMLFGWKIDFGVILMDNPVNHHLIDFLNQTAFYTRHNGSDKFVLMQGIHAAEDLFSTIDFKRFVLKQRVGITVKNSEYIETNNLSRMILVSEFLASIQAENLQMNDFDEETRNNFEKLFAMITNTVEKE
jgi:predicted ATP-dependent endonuclease of OLD family